MNWWGNFLMQNKRQLTIGVYCLLKFWLSRLQLSIVFIRFCTRNCQYWIKRKDSFLWLKAQKLDKWSQCILHFREKIYEIYKKIQINIRTSFLSGVVINCLVLPIVIMIILSINHLSYNTVFWFTPLDSFPFHTPLEESLFWYEQLI